MAIISINIYLLIFVLEIFFGFFVQKLINILHIHK